MGFHNHHYPRPLVPNTQDPSAVDFRAFYPYTPNEVKHRKRTTSQQLKVLETIFKKDTKPNAQLRQELAAELNMTARGVQVWFQNRRAKEKARAGRASLTNHPSSAFLHDVPEGSLKEEDATVVVKSEVIPNETALADPPCEDSKELIDASQASSSHIPSPPQLRVITDTSGCDWDAANSPVEPPPDSAASYVSTGLPAVSGGTTAVNNRSAGMEAGPEDLYSLRRGSLPITNAFAQQQLSAESESLDPLVRRCSVDASLQRLAAHPYAGVTRAKNSALYGTGFGVTPHNALASNGVTFVGPEQYHRNNRLQHVPNRLQRRFVSSSALSTAAQYGASLPPHAAYVRRLSMDSRASRLGAMQRTHYSPSPSPLSTYSATVRASLPEPHLYSLANRSVASPLPGPLPQPGFQFGAATSSTPSIASPSSADSERNSPDSLKSFTFGGEEEGHPSPSYESYSSRFGSIASIATSESSVHSVYYGSTVDRMERRDSSCTAPYLSVSHEVDVGHPLEYARNCQSVAEIDNRMGMGTGVVVGYSPPEEYASYQGTEGSSLVHPEMHQMQQQQQQQESLQHRQVYVSPITPSTVIGGDVQTPHAQDPPAMLISSSSELAFALKSENPEMAISTTQPSAREAYVTYASSEQHSVAQSPVEQFEHPSVSGTYYGTEVQQYQEQQSAYSSAYPYASDMQAAPPPSEYGIFSSTADYPDHMASSHILNNGLQGVEAFVAYT